MASSDVDGDEYSHPTNSAVLDRQAASSDQAMDCEPSAEAEALFDSSTSLQMGPEDAHSTSLPNQSAYLWPEYTPWSSPSTNPQNSLSSSQFCATNYPSSNTTGIIDLLDTPTDPKSQRLLDLTTESINIPSDDEDVDRASIPSLSRDRPHPVVKQEPLETDQFLFARTNCLDANTNTGGELAQDCQQVLEEFMANVQRQSEHVDMGNFMFLGDEGVELMPEMFSESRAACNIKQEADAVSDHADLGEAAMNRPQLLENMAENAELLNEQDSLLFFPESHSPAPEMQFFDQSMAAYQPANTVEHNPNQFHEPTPQPSDHRPRQGPGRRREKDDSTRTKVRKDKVRKPGANAGKKAKGGRRPQVRKMFEIESLMPYDLPQQVQNNLREPSPPRFTSTNKTEALKQLIASIPEPQRELHRQDKNDLLTATKKFKGHGAMRPDGEGKWRLRGLKTTLHHYQVMGCARMRESEEKGPFGGILADDMGLGKTVMALANIINGSPNGPEDSPRATLIVAPASLTSQWFSEVVKHVDMKRPPGQRVMVYRSAQSAYSSHAEFFLGLHDIVITSYNELNKSMPNNKPPKDLVTSRAKEEWFEEYFKTHRGALHRVKWLRIVLDEAHAIKNHESKTSNAAYRLNAKYRWALSGTPVQNSLTEFFAYFRFLRVRGTGDFKLFKKNYCKRGSEKALERLRVRLEGFVIRRTHKDILFGRPIIQLPPIENRTVELEFSLVEKEIYDIVHMRFKTRVEKWKKTMAGSQVPISYSAIYVLLLRLRQLTAHILLIEKTLNDLLEAEDLDRLWNLVGREQSQLGDGDRKLLHGLEMILKVRKEANNQRNSQGAPLDTGLPELQSHKQRDSALSRRFHEYHAAMLHDNLLEMANQLSLCQLCRNPPKNPRITSCCHVYCLDCIEVLTNEASAAGSDKATCAECSVQFDKTEELTIAGDVPVEVEQSQQSQQAEADEQESCPRCGSSHSSSDKSFDWYRYRPVPRSTKMAAVVKQMEEWFATKDEKGNENKVLVFSQFKGVLKAFSSICNENGWKHEVFHGEMSMEARSRAVETFSSDKSCKALLAGMKCGGVGLNLTAANKVILIDLWWNVAAETQAFCRVFRIGQERPCEVVRFAIKSTIDIQILRMQERKSQEIEAGMTLDGGSVRDLLELFGSTDDSTGGKNVAGFDDDFILPNDPYAK
ncbi:hypothetical protein DV738_g3421, partial [Chaetothyriales sp. CBS 135597]